MSTRALYYPFIRPRSDEWLKKAALVWHAVERIVPPGYAPKDSRTAKVLTQEGILVDLDPADSAAAIKDRLLDALARRAGDIQREHGLSPEERALRVRGGVHPEFLQIPATRKLAWLHDAKVDPSVKGALSDGGLAILVGDWIGMRTPLVEVYMAALAGDLARSGRFDAVTDQPRANVLSGRWSVEELASMLAGEAPKAKPVSPAEAEYRLALCAVELAAPEAAKASVEDIVKIRREFRTEFGVFRNSLHTFQDQLARNLEGVTDPRRVDQIIQELHAETIAVENANLEDALSLAGFASARTLLGVQVTVSSGGLGALAAATTGIPLVGLGAALVVAVAGIGADYMRERSKARRDTPSSYLLGIRQHARLANG